MYVTCLLFKFYVINLFLYIFYNPSALYAL